MNNTKSFKSSNLIAKSNHLIESSYKIGLIELKIISKLSSQINKDDNDFKKYTFRAKELLEEFGLGDKNYKEIEKASKKLLSRTLTIKKSEDNILLINFLSSVEYKKNEGIIELCFDPKLKPYLFELKGFFTSYHLKNVINLKSVYAIRMYELLKQYETIGNRTIRVEHLKNILGIDKNKYAYNMFKKRVILTAQQELSQNTDIYFEFEEIKHGRKIQEIKFQIISKKRLKSNSKNWLIKEELSAKKKLLKQNQLYKDEDLKRNIEVQKIKDTKIKITKWSKENKEKFEKIQAKYDGDYLKARIFVEKEVLKI